MSWHEQDEDTVRQKEMTVFGALSILRGGDQEARVSSCRHARVMKAIEYKDVVF